MKRKHLNFLWWCFAITTFVALIFDKAWIAFISMILCSYTSGVITAPYLKFMKYVYNPFDMSKEFEKLCPGGHTEKDCENCNILNCPAKNDTGVSKQ